MDYVPVPETAPVVDSSFMALPSDPSVPLTPEQLDYLFAGADRTNALRDLVRVLRRSRSAASEPTKG